MNGFPAHLKEGARVKTASGQRGQIVSELVFQYDEGGVSLITKGLQEELTLVGPECPYTLSRDLLRRFPIEGMECTLPAGHAGEHHHDAIWIKR